MTSAVVMGSGPNGREAAIRLAREGLEVRSWSWELKTNTELARQIQRLVVELDQRTRPTNGPDHSKT